MSVFEICTDVVAFTSEISRESVFSNGGENRGICSPPAAAYWLTHPSRDRHAERGGSNSCGRKQRIFAKNHGKRRINPLPDFFTIQLYSNLDIAVMTSYHLLHGPGLRPGSGN